MTPQRLFLGKRPQPFNSPHQFKYRPPGNFFNTTDQEFGMWSSSWKPPSVGRYVVAEWNYGTQDVLEFVELRWPACTPRISKSWKAPPRANGGPYSMVEIIRVRSRPGFPPGWRRIIPAYAGCARRYTPGSNPGLCPRHEFRSAPRCRFPWEWCP